VSKRAESHTRNLVLAVLLMVSIGASAETLTGTVVGVADGDTITVLDANREEHKIRLGGLAGWFVLTTLADATSSHAERSAQGPKSPYDEVTPELAAKYFQRTFDLTPEGEGKSLLRGANAPKYWVPYGVEVCKLLRFGAPDSQIRQDISSFYGHDLGNALIEAAKDVFCPEFKR